MKITDVKVMMFTIPFPPGHTWASGATGSQSAWDAIIVRIFTDEGLTGIGESFHQNHPEPVAERIAKIYTPLLIGMDPFDREAIWERLTLISLRSSREAVNAMSGIDVALWDIIGKAVGQPVYKLLGTTNNKVKPYAGGWTLGMRQAGEFDKLADEARSYLKKGYLALKMAGGRTPSQWRLDVEAVKTVREAVGPDVPLMLDVKSSYDEPTALKLARGLEPYDLFWFESPIFAATLYSTDRLAAFSNRVNMPVATGGNIYSRFELKQLIANGYRGVIMLNVAKTGGFTDAMLTAGICSAWGLPLSAQGIGSPLNYVQAAILQAAAPPHIAKDMFFEMEPVMPMNEFLTNPLHFENGVITLPEGPGLGTDIREDAAKKFPFNRSGDRIRGLLPTSSRR